MSNLLLFLPVILPFFWGVFIWLCGRRNETLAAVLTSLFCLGELAACVVLCLKGGECEIPVLGLSFSYEGFHGVYGAVCAFMWAGSALLNRWYFSGHHNLTRYLFFLLLTLGATLGVFVSADLLTTFIFFEIMSFTSYMWVIQEETPEAFAAGKTYLTIAVLGGLVSLMGLFLIWHLCGTLTISELVSAPKSPMLYAACFCLLFGFGAKAGMYPLHIWLPKAHPVAPAPASALLSGVLTKAGLYGILVIVGTILRYDTFFASVLLILGAITMLWGAVLAVSSINLKRTLACSSMSQIGFILVGIGISAFLGEENQLAANGVFLYMMNHSIVKLVLFLLAGVIFGKFHTLDLNELKGTCRGKPLLLIPYLAGAMSLSGLPGFLGYLAKTLIHEGIAEYAAESTWIFHGLEYLFLFCGGLTLSYMIKLFVVLFLEKGDGSHQDHHPLPGWINLVLLVPSALLILPGVCPAVGEQLAGRMCGFLAGEPLKNYAFYSLNNLKGIAISACVGVAVYFLVIRTVFRKNGRYVDRIPEKIALERILYLPLGKGLIAGLGFISRCVSGLTDAAVPAFLRIFGALSRIVANATDTVLPVVLKISGILSRVAADLTDAVVLVLKRTVFTEATRPEEVESVNFVCRAAMRSAKRHGKDPVAAGERAAQLEEAANDTASRLTKTFSFAMLMTCIGLCVALLFMLLAGSNGLGLF